MQRNLREAIKNILKIKPRIRASKIQEFQLFAIMKVIAILTCFACSKEALVHKLKFKQFKSQQNLLGADQD